MTDATRNLTRIATVHAHLSDAPVKLDFGCFHGANVCISQTSCPAQLFAKALTTEWFAYCKLTL